jgi:hypothetical protein
MVEKVHGLVPEQGTWSEGPLTFVSIAAADDAALDAAVKLAGQFATILGINVVGGVAHMILGYAANDGVDGDLAPQTGLEDAGFTVYAGFQGV